MVEGLLTYYIHVNNKCNLFKECISYNIHVYSHIHFTNPHLFSLPFYYSFMLPYPFILSYSPCSLSLSLSPNPIAKH